MVVPDIPGEDAAAPAALGGVSILVLPICLLAIPTILLLFLLLKLARNYLLWHTSPLNKIPGPKNRSFFKGCFPEIRKEPFMTPHKRWLDEVMSDGGDRRRKTPPLLHYTTLVGRHNVLVLDKAIVRAILAAPECSGSRSGPRYQKRYFFLQSRVGDGLVTLEGQHWMRHRRIIQPSFHVGVLRDRLTEVVPARLVKFWKSLAAGDEEIAVSDHMSALTLDVVGTVLFSHEFGALQRLEEQTKEGRISPAHGADSFASLFTQSFMLNPLSIFFTVTGLTKLDPVFNPKVWRTQRLLNKAVDQVLQNANKSDYTDKDNEKSLLHLLFEAQDPDAKGCNGKLSWEELRDEAKTFLMAGHETTSTWLYWVLYALAKHPDVQEKLHQDLQRSGSTVEELESNNYLNGVLNETLRLYPPVGMLSRFNADDETLAGYRVPRSTRLTISFLLLHRHPDYWDDPESFLPERWIDPTDEERERRRFAFLPFSAGGRNCIGQRFAWLEARLILAPIVRNFAIRVAPSQRGAEHELTNTVTMKSKPGLKIVVKRRG